VIYGTGRALNMFLTALLLPLFTSFMSSSDYGIIGMVVTFITAVDVFITLGFDVAFSRFFFDNKDPHHRSKVLTHVFYVDFVYPAIVLGLLIAFMPQISRFIMGAPGYTLYFDIGLASEFFINLSDLPYQLLRMEHRAWTFASFTIARVLIQAPLSVVFLAVFHWGPMGYLLANLFTVVVLNIAALPYYVPRLIRTWDWKLMRAMLDFAVPALFTAMSFYFLKLSDRFFVLHYQGKAQVGLYTVANALAQPLYIVGMAFRMAWPQWHYAYLDDPVAHKRMIARSSTYFLAFNGLFLALIGLYLPLGMHILLNRHYWSIGPTTFVLTVSVALFNLYFIFWVGCNVAKKNRMVPVITLIASGVNVGLNFILVPKYGMWAAAWTTTLGFFILAFLIYFVSQHWYPIPYEWRRLLAVLVATTLTLGAAWAIGGAVGLSVSMPLRELVLHELLVTPALALFPLTLWATHFLSPIESRTLRSIPGRLTGRRRGPQVAMAGAEGAAVALPAGPAPARREADDDPSYQHFVEETESEIEAEDMLELGKDEDTTG
jgi:O-antigen/teichoic acid export membrane protein